MIKNIGQITAAHTPATHASGQGGRTAAAGFGEMLGKAMGEVNARYSEADQAASDLATGRSKDVHQVMIAMEKADVSFRLLMQVRNKIVSAYENIMRTQI